MIEFRSVNKTYKSKRGASCHAVKDATLSLGDKGMYFILGKSGSGKSTLLNLIGGLDKTDSGEILYNGRAFSSFKERDFEAYRNNVVGFIFQEYNLMGNMDVYSNVNLALNLQNKRNKTENEKTVTDALSLVELDGYEKRNVSELSGGQQQRVAIARAIVKQSDIILADEPTGNLDSETGKDIFEILKKISENKLVIVVSHDRESAENYGDGIIEIKDGVIVTKSQFVTDKISNSTPSDVNARQEFKSAKLPWGFTLGFAFRNLLQKKFRSILTIISTILMVVFICGMHVFYSVDTNRNIALSAENIGVNYFSLRQKTTHENGFSTYYTDIENYNAYSNAKSLKGVHAFIGYDCELYIQGSILLQKNDVNESTNKQTAYVSFPLKTLAYIIESKSDLTDAGFTLYDGATEPTDSGVYLSDVGVTFLLKRGFYFEEELTDFNLMAGKTITEKIVSSSGTKYNHIKLDGIIKTGVINYLQPPKNAVTAQSTFNVDEEPTVAQINEIREIACAAFMSEQCYISNYYSNSLGSFDTSQKVEQSISSGKAEIPLINLDFYAPYAISQFADNFAYVMTEDGLKNLSDYYPTEDEVVLPVNTYNALFPDDYLTAHELSYEELSSLEIKHLGENISPILKRTGVDKNLFAKESLKIAGVVLSDAEILYDDSNQGRIFTLNATSPVAFDSDIYLYLNDDRILITYDDVRSFEKALDALKDNYSLSICDSDYFANVFYTTESVFVQVANVFLILFLLSMLVSVLLLVNLISFNVSARKKDIGILKALGTSNFDLKKIFISETLMLSLLALIIGAIGTIWLVSYANTLTYNYVAGMIFFVATPITYLLMSMVTLVVMPILAFLPLYKITKLNPVDAIKK